MARIIYLKNVYKQLSTSSLRLSIKHIYLFYMLSFVIDCNHHVLPFDEQHSIVVGLNLLYGLHTNIFPIDFFI